MADLVERSSKRRRFVISSSPSEEDVGKKTDAKLQRKAATCAETFAEVPSLNTKLPTTPDIPYTPRSSSLEEDVASVESDGGCHTAYKKRGFVHLPRPSLPSAAFEGWEPPDSISTEAFALSQLSPDISQSADGFRYIELEDFTIYRPEGSKRGVELCGLDRLQALRADELCFSGYLSTENTKHFVHNVSFRVLAIDGYGDFDCHSIHDKMCIQSIRAQNQNVWYRLGRPAAEYKAFFEPFLWLATFTKFFLDCLLQEASVDLVHFRSKFAARLCRRYGHLARFRAWHEQSGSQKDFRTSVAAHMGFLYKECHSIHDSTVNLFRHPVWAEAHPTSLSAITRTAPLAEDDATIVTPFAHRCFESMYFASHLSIKKPNVSVIPAITERKRELCLTPWDSAPKKKPKSLDRQQNINIHQGDVVCIAPDVENSWKLSTSEVWYAYVQKIRDVEGEGQVLDVLWLYEPADTTLGAAYYPFENELFLSDICDCGDSAIPIEDVAAKLDVSWFVSDPHSVQGFFIRQKYRAKEEEDLYSFTTLTSNDFCCAHAHEHLEGSQDDPTHYTKGDVVLVRPRDTFDSEALLEPARVLRFDHDRQKFILRKLIRSANLKPEAHSNELEEGYDELAVRAPRIVRRFKIAYFASRNDVVTPYDRGGAGDYFFMLNADLKPESSLETPPISEVESEPKPQHRPLIGLGLYCGGGNFDRGLEEGGAVKFKYAVDWDTPALHSYRANIDRPNDIQYFLGSVNDYLHRAMRDSNSGKIAAPGRIGLISGGSPCPGFSNMQPDKQSFQSLKFASMVASVVAFVDFYSPEYLILENVVAMASTMEVNGKQHNVFRQILAALVALGYQVQQFLMDAWTVGSSQKRSRVFIVASAPGHAPLPTPPMTHAHPPGQLNRSLGKTVNGLTFDQRRDDFTPFRHVSARESCKDLPVIGDSLLQICPRFPDHRVSVEENPTVLQRLARIPTYPHGMGIAQAVSRGYITSGEAYRWLKSSNPTRSNPYSRSYARLKPDGLFPTILTKITLQCGFNGNFVHWSEHRGATIMETRRAQGFLDHEVIVGLPSEQQKIVGNSVDRKVAFTMGMAIKESLDLTRRASRRMLQGDGVEEQGASADGELERILDGRLQPSPAQLQSMRREVIRERSEALAGIIQSLREKRRFQGEENLQPPEWAIKDMDVDGSPRWAGDSPADTIAVRRRTSELETVIRPHQKHTSHVDLT